MKTKYNFCLIVLFIISKMGENGIYGNSQFLLQHILAVPESCGYQHSFLIEDMEGQILRIIKEHKFEVAADETLNALAEDLDELSKVLGDGLKLQTPAEEILRVRSHQLAIAKILVFTYGKSDFRLASAHFHQGRAYLQNNAHEQAVNHLTIASTKVSKMSDIKQTKIYNSFILTTLGLCYYQQARFDYSLQVLTRAFDIQNSNQIAKNNLLAKYTLQLLARTYLKLPPPEDSRLRKEREQFKLKSQQQAIKLIDRLIDVLAVQFVDFQSAYIRSVHLIESYRRNFDSEDGFARQFDIPLERMNTRRKGEHLEFSKLLQFLEDKIEYIVIDVDRKALRRQLACLRREETKKISILQELSSNLRKLLEDLAESLKRQRLFKFKVLLSCALVTNSTDQELKIFLQEYERQDSDSFKKLSHEETIEIYKLLLSYSARFSDNENQLVYLQKLDRLYSVSEDTPKNQLEILNIRRNLAKLYSQMHMESQSLEILADIKALQLKLYGPTSKPVKRTQSMLKLAKRESEYQKENIKRESVIGQKLNLRKTVLLSTHAPRILEGF